jgi:uncharacterized protein YjbJ (UPF0337 family)
MRPRVTYISECQIGNVTGQKDWQRDGQAEHRRGEAEYDAARAKGFVEGVGDRISGKKDAVLGALKGDKSQQIQGEQHHQVDGMIN